MTRARASRRYLRWQRYVNRYPWWKRPNGWHNARHAALKHRPHVLLRAMRLEMRKIGEAREARQR